VRRIQRTIAERNQLMTQSIDTLFARPARVVLLTFVALLATFGVGVGAAPVTAAQGAAGHPLVGSWILDSDADDPANAPSLAVFSSDGTYLETDEDGTAYGVWEATGERTATLTIVFLDVQEGVLAGTGTIRATVEAAEDGESLTASYTFEFTGADGASSGEIGPGAAVASRIAVETPGTPIASFEEAFGPPEATPAP
jgi:hypothetical protein